VFEERVKIKNNFVDVIAVLSSNHQLKLVSVLAEPKFRSEWACFPDELSTGAANQRNPILY
jgi:hypothetical protein